MLVNRSMSRDVVVPVLGYPSVPQAVEWLVAAFGFTRRWQVGDHRAQLGVGPDAAIAIAAHRERARAAGAVVSQVGDYPYGERQYTATDPTGRRWVFSQSIADVAPGDWGATAG